MKMKIKDFALYIFLITYIAIAILGIIFGYQYTHDQTTLDAILKLEHFKSVDKGISYNGLYSPSDDYYCVWPDERDPISISKIEAHEYCHYLIDNYNKSHFCK